MWGKRYQELLRVCMSLLGVLLHKEKLEVDVEQGVAQG